MSTALAPQRVVSDLLEEYHEKLEALPAAVEAYAKAGPDLQSAATVYGAYAGSVVSNHSAPHVSHAQKLLLCSAWKAVYSRLQIDMIASANDKRDWERFLADPVPFSMVTVREKFGPYLLDPWTNVLRGLAEVFCDLDPAYKSHSKVKIGVKGLPKRVILNYWTSYNNGARDKLRDIINAIRAYERRPLLSYGELMDFIDFNKALVDGHYPEWSPEKEFRAGHKVMRDEKLYKFEGYYHRAGDPFIVSNEKGWREIPMIEPGIEIRVYPGAQTCHVIFKPDTLLAINRALAEFYGEVLPDIEPDDVKPRASTAVSKDLAYYPTPAKVIQAVLSALEIYGEAEYSYHSRDERPRYYVLEPSCGDGRFLDEIKTRGHRSLGIEVDAGRAEASKFKGHSVMTANFLQVRPEAAFDFVVMNPPFAGQHWMKHLSHALKFLKPKGKLACILPATAHYDHDVEKEFGGAWTDLPVGSFSESGTNVPTGYLIIRK